MLIVNDEQRLRAGIANLSQRCCYCSKALAAYPLIVSDEATLSVYHAACAAELVTEVLVDLYTFFRPPAPYQHLFVLDLRATRPEEVRECSHRTWTRSRRRYGCKLFMAVQRCAVGTARSWLFGEGRGRSWPCVVAGDAGRKSRE